MKCVCILTGEDYKPGDPRPEGYLAWHEWADVQWKAGLRQKVCADCCKWKFPQELSDEERVSHAITVGKDGIENVEMRSPICKGCVARRSPLVEGAEA